MPVDPSLRSAVDGAFGSPTEPESTDLDTLAEIRHLARTTRDVRVKAQLLRVLREEERDAERRTAPERAHPFAGDTTEELFGFADEATAATLRSILNGGMDRELSPITRELLDGEFERRVEEAAGKRADVAEFERRVEERARELAEARVAAMREEVELEARRPPADAELPPPRREPDELPPGIGDDRGWD
jgi:hypothetical protein